MPREKDDACVLAAALDPHPEGRATQKPSREHGAYCCALSPCGRGLKIRATSTNWVRGSFRQKRFCEETLTQTSALT